MDSVASAGQESFSLGAARVEPGRNSILAGGRLIRLEPKVMDVLVALAEAGGDVVARETLIERVWNVEHGGDESVSRAVSLLRKALKEAGLGDKAIETVTKRGYRLAVAPIAGDAVAGAVSLATASGAQGARGRRRLAGLWPLAAAAGVAIAALAALFVWRTHAGAARPQEAPVVAVLPFDDLSPKADHAWFAEGLADELIDNLAKAPGLTVIARTSSFRFANIGLDARVIGDRLGARYLVEGGVRREGDNFRISATLVDSRSGTTLWSKTYERESAGIFETQADIAREIAGALNVRIAQGAIEEILQRTDSPQAFDAFLLGHAFLRAEGPDNIKRAADQFRLATRLDPEFVDAWLGLVTALSVHDFWRPEEYAQIKPERAAAIARALALAPALPGPRIFQAWETWAAGDVRKALEQMRSVIPRDNQSCGFYSFVDVVSLGRIEPGYGDCITTFLKGDPYSLPATQDAQFIAHLIGRADIEESEYTRSKTLPGGPGLGEIYAFLRAFNDGDRERARTHFRAMIDFLPARIAQFEAVHENFHDDARVLALLNEARIDPANQDPTRLIMIAKLLAIYGDPEGAADALRRHFIDAGGTWWQELWMPEHAATRRQPAFREIVRAKGFEAFFRSENRWNDFCRPVGDNDFECF